LLIFFAGLISNEARLFAVEAPQSKLDQRIQAGFTALQAKNWKQAQSYFEEAVKIFEGKPSASPLILTKLSLSPSNTVITVNGKPRDVSGEVNSFRQVMGTQQALYEFAAFTSQLAGDNQNAEKYLNKVDEMRGVMWGRSWTDLIPQIHTLFFSYLSSDNSENFSQYLFMAGRLLLSVEDSDGIKLIREAKQILPKDPTIPALLASYMITHNDPSTAKSEAQVSLALSPNQPSVLIDLATAQWMIGEFDGASKAARRAAELNPDLPGPHATLAFIALETDDKSSALKEAEIGNKLSNGHRFFKTILAVCLEAAGNTQQAKSLMVEAWKGDSPDEEQLKAWFFRGKALELARKFMKQRG
jgi:tetratricopeptide (TPR) repeat protein